ncbi:hypothetical protein D9Q98_001823 [Chlorella vulgaris]|uniref:Uncharacterized protein n=1 Tax=Chlorella vulgaris TaxID=3077 RepID=A0A9D4Z033_CHLVU|nr:hypothetical protein D9Q98_001823 [Chlorella vulgaris]
MPGTRTYVRNGAARLALSVLCLSLAAPPLFVTAVDWCMPRGTGPDPPCPEPDQCCAIWPTSLTSTAIAAAAITIAAFATATCTTATLATTTLTTAAIATATFTTAAPAAATPRWQTE